MKWVTGHTRSKNKKTLLLTKNTSTEMFTLNVDVFKPLAFVQHSVK